MYIFTIFGNVFLIATVLKSPKLHLPMYFFLCNLSIIDLTFSSSSIPKLFVDIFSARRTISITACMVQMNIGMYLGSTESLLLAVMAYDRYVAISFPLYYNIIMNWKMCRTLVIIMWPGNFFISVVPIISRPLVFCMENKLNHFVCEILAVLELACGNLTFFKAALFVESLFTLVLPLVFIVISYILILSSILKIRSTDGRSKAFSTCASHLTVVSMFYGTTISMYVGQKKNFYSNMKYISLVYGVITPVLNPLIYSLRNNDVKRAFKKIFVKFES
ncbi:olfactory receptor 13H1-like [Mantella aurantiaca]